MQFSVYLVKLRNLVGKAGGVAPSARKLSIRQDQARRLLATLKDEQADDAELGTTG